jgi:hypothetical protein
MVSVVLCRFSIYVQGEALRYRRTGVTIPRTLPSRRLKNKKVVQADNPELGIACLLGNNDCSFHLRLEHGLIGIITLFVKGDF